MAWGPLSQRLGRPHDNPWPNQTGSDYEGEAPLGSEDEALDYPW